jgi:hypothetical protein
MFVVQELRPSGSLRREERAEWWWRNSGGLRKETRRNWKAPDLIARWPIGRPYPKQAPSALTSTRHGDVKRRRIGSDSQEADRDANLRQLFSFFEMKLRQLF